MTESGSKQCRKCGQGFTHSEDAFALYSKVGLKPSEDCFSCRVQQKMAFWNYGKFRKGKSDLSGESLITVLPAEPRFPIYTTKEWWSDDWEAPEMDYDQAKPFFVQFKELQEQTPHPHQLAKNNVNCDWCDDVWDSKNCYLSKSMVGCENARYGYRIVNIKDSLDITYGFDTSQSYDVTYCFNAYRVKYSLNVRDSIDSMFLYDCRNVQDCFMSWNLRGKQYYYKNEQFSKEEYKRKLAEYNFGSWETISKLKDEWNEILREKAVHRENINLKAYNSFGNFLTNCKNCNSCFYWETSEDCTYCFRGLNCKSSIDFLGTFEAELCGAVTMTLGGYMSRNMTYCTECRFCEYLDQCVSCENCFGCVGLKKGTYRILNKQYSKEEYEKLKAQIVESMKKDGTYGEFLPYDMTYGGYNMSIAHMYKDYTRTKEDISALGGHWDNTDTSVEGTSTDQLPDSIRDVTDNIIQKGLVCPKTGWLFNIAKDDLTFYRQHEIPLPRYHFDRRTNGRFEYISTTKTYRYKCTFCDKEIDAYYPPEWGYKRIACAECYQKEIS